ncbi:MAG: SLC13 family permease [Chloroflexi bacterium]|uniref:SLC13 family permease n=1 Tax=Candidatus Thermofonsia Clade 3 bacterium TaxID=2364212 RepID=A0A2M8QCC0_9CHLR|nr:MAG: SLC13 family permease [Candidatus Thermofonsia Clade 3 bacterium]RMG65339.1 MAG: SLC13 family permease [Chloroflexota bacterium]
MAVNWTNSLSLPVLTSISPVVALTLILAIAFALMLTDRLRPDLVAIGVALSLGLTGIIEPNEVFIGFSSSAVVTIIGIFILAQGLQRTGVTRAFGRVLAQANRGGERGMIALVMSSGACLSLFMNNIAAAAVLLPGAVDAVKRRKLIPSKIMMPMAFATSLGGMATLLTTANIVVSEALTVSGQRGYGLLDFVLVGVPVTLAGILFMLTLGRRLLPTRDPTALDPARANSHVLTESYELFQRLNRIRIPPTSSLVNQRIVDSGIGKQYGMSVMAVLRNGQTVLAPSPDEIIRAHDTLLVIGRRERAEQLRQYGAIVEPDSQFEGEITSDDVSLVEVIPAPRSRAIGQTLRQLRFREKFGASVLALWHGGRSVRTDLATLPLEFGDAMLVHGSREAISLLQSDSDFLVLRPPAAEESPVRADRAVVAVVILIAALTTAALDIVPIALATMLGALAMVLVGCLSMDEAYRAIDWRAVFLIAGMLPVSIAMQRTGAADELGRVITALLSGFGPVAVGAGLLTLTMLLTQVMSGQVTAVVLAPIAISTAQAIGSDPRAMAMFVALGCSLTFITPSAHPVNTFVMGAGGYQASDYPRVGVPLTLICVILIIALVTFVWRP